MVSDYGDNRQLVIDRMNTARTQRGLPALTPRQEHLVREFADDYGVINDADADLLFRLLQSNSD